MVSCAVCLGVLFAWCVSLSSIYTATRLEAAAFRCGARDRLK